MHQYKSLSNLLHLIEAAEAPDHVNTAPMALRLGMHFRITMHLTGGSKQQPRFDPPRQAQHVVCTKKAGFGCFDRVELVVQR